MTTAVCYVATSSHLFQTIQSAIQTRQHVDPAVAVTVVHVQQDPATRKAFDRVCAENDVLLLASSGDLPEGLHPSYARLFVDRDLPPSIDEVLYIDGDTQILEDLTPLLATQPPPGGVVAIHDPMVLLQQTRHFHQRVNRWWIESCIPVEARPRYINTGVLRFRTTDLAAMRREVLRLRARDGDPRFREQDLLNRALDGRLITVGMEWNFPAFLMRSRLSERVVPRILHFMSNPRPWEGPYSPWGWKHHRPYSTLARQYPELEEFWIRSDRVGRLRYAAQQAAKRFVERPIWQSEATLRSFELLQRSVDQVP